MAPGFDSPSVGERRATTEGPIRSRTHCGPTHPLIREPKGGGGSETGQGVACGAAGSSNPQLDDACRGSCPDHLRRRADRSLGRSSSSRLGSPRNCAAEAFRPRALVSRSDPSKTRRLCELIPCPRMAGR